MILKHDMNERERYFFDNIIIKEEDVVRAKRAIYSKGIEKHISILDMLKVWGMGEKVPYEYIASFYRYDKRLRKVLFVYISYLEEYYRSIILDNFKFKVNELKPVYSLKKELSKSHDLDKALEKIEFSKLIKQIGIIHESVHEHFVFPSNSHLQINILALIELRNSVMHNRLLLLYRGFKECYIENANIKSATLKDNILNLISFLPPEVRDKCKKEINSCLEEKNNDGKTEWKVPPMTIIIV